MAQPSDILFQVASDLTGGLITDLQTAMLGMVAVAFIVFGFDYLREVFEQSINTRNTNASLDRARSYKNMSESMDDQVSKDYFNARYRNEIRKAAK